MMILILASSLFPLGAKHTKQLLIAVQVNFLPKVFFNFKFRVWV